MMTKQDCLDLLNKDDKFKKILESAKPGEERDAIKATVENFISTFVDRLTPAGAEIRKNPQKFVKEIDPSLITIDTNKSGVEKK